MLILLPPSETKAFPISGAVFNLAALSFPELASVRAELVDDLVRLCNSQPNVANELLKLSPRQAEEVRSNASLLVAATAPALEVYTGVLYDALDPATLPPNARSALVVGSALFGLVGADDAIAHYRLSATSKVPRKDGSLPTVRARWGQHISQALASCESELIIDLRSGGYRNLGKPPAAIPSVQVRVVDERGKVISHFNKHYKGLLARALVLSGEQPHDAADVCDIATDAGFVAHILSAEQIQLTV